MFSRDTHHIMFIIISRLNPAFTAEKNMQKAIQNRLEFVGSPELLLIQVLLGGFKMKSPEAVRRGLAPGTREGTGN